MHDGILKKLCYHATNNVPRYRGLKADIHCFPTVAKADFCADIRSHISLDVPCNIERLTEALVRNEKFDASWKTAANVFSKDLLIEETTGTSGIPLRFIRGVSERSRIAIGIWRYRKKIDPEVARHNFYPFFHRPSSIRDLYDPLDTAESNVLRLYSYLSTKGIRWIHCYPSMLLRHANAISEPLAGNSTLRFAESSGVFLNIDVIKAVNQKLKINLVNQYGCMEVSAIGYSRESSLFIVLRDNVLVELLDSEGQTITEPNVEGQVVVTSKHQFFMPFIRYKTGDRARWVDGAIGESFELIHAERDVEDPVKWGTWQSGARYFRVMMQRCYEKLGFITVRFLQIREEPDLKFRVLLSPISQPERFLNVLESVCRDEPSIKIRGFSMEIVDGDLLEYYCQKKPQLFIALAGVR